MILHLYDFARGIFLWLAVVGLGTASLAWGGESALVIGPAQVQADGTVVVRDQALATRLGGPGEVREVRFDFGMPNQPAAQRWLEQSNLPICHTLWEKDGVRYTQTVLIGRLDGDGTMGAGQNVGEKVIMVRLAGENTATVYSNAAAALTVRVGGQTLKLELRDDVAHWIGPEKFVPLAVVDISPSATVTTNGTRLEFSGNMPPGTTGSMTIKIPLVNLDQPVIVERVRELEFEDEFQRIKKAATR